MAEIALTLHVELAAAPAASVLHGLHEHGAVAGTEAGLLWLLDMDAEDGSGPQAALQRAVMVAESLHALPAWPADARLLLWLTLACEQEFFRLALPAALSERLAWQGLDLMLNVYFCPCREPAAPA